MKVVLDTNVLLAAVLADGLCRDLVSKRIRAHELLTSDVLLDELAGQFRKRFDVNPDEIPFLTAYRERATLVSPLPLPAPVCRDSDDDWVLATAVAGRADVVVTGDQDLLVLGQYAGVRILSPRQFLEMLDREI
ncbi:MAG: putative toxin-antitoxin system toxin component, PIN family [Verrucomicrobiae bacterium]|nr:putative toxin-antitoxin system toxin component, PIN family [Verrucomicrobiae bacterium]